VHRGMVDANRFWQISVVTSAVGGQSLQVVGSMPFRVERNTDSLAWRRPPIPPPFPPAGRARVALCRQGCGTEKPCPTTLWQAFAGRGSVKAKPYGWPAAST
jgi:hypothetical protein